MKPYQTQTYYELLDVPVAASEQDIREAFTRAMALYDPDSVVLYSLVEPAQAEELRGRLQEALGTLMDPEHRERYDRELGLPEASHSTHPDVSVAYPPPREDVAPKAPEVVEVPKHAAPPVPVEPSRPKPLEIPPDAEFNGELLRRVRESRGLSLAQVADRTRIGKSHLENVEADRYAALPTTVYLRGMVMNFARELGLDPVRVSKSYLALATAKRKPS